MNVYSPYVCVCSRLHKYGRILYLDVARRRPRGARPRARRPRASLPRPAAPMNNALCVGLLVALEAAASAGSRHGYPGHGEHEAPFTSTFQLSPGRPGELSAQTPLAVTGALLAAGQGGDCTLHSASVGSSSDASGVPLSQLTHSFSGHLSAGPFWAMYVELTWVE